MSSTDWAYLAARTAADFENGGHRTYFQPSLAAVAATGADAAASAAAAAASSAASSAVYALHLGLGISAYGVGVEPMALPRTVQLGSAAFATLDSVRGIFPSLQNGAYTILPQDHGKLIYCTSGTNTWTFLDADEYPEGWYCNIRNRSGNNLTLNPTGANTLNGGASVTVATGAAMLTAVRTSATGIEAS